MRFSKEIKLNTLQEQILIENLLAEINFKNMVHDLFKMLKTKKWDEIKKRFGKTAKTITLISLVLKSLIAAGEVTAQEANQYLQDAKQNIKIEQASQQKTPSDIYIVAKAINTKLSAQHINAAVDDKNNVLIIRVDGRAELNDAKLSHVEGIITKHYRMERLGDYKPSLNQAYRAYDLTGTKKRGDYKINPTTLNELFK